MDTGGYPSALLLVFSDGSLFIGGMPGRLLAAPRPRPPSLPARWLSSPSLCKANVVESTQPG